MCDVIRFDPIVFLCMIDGAAAAEGPESEKESHPHTQQQQAISRRRTKSDHADHHRHTEAMEFVMAALAAALPVCGVVMWCQTEHAITFDTSVGLSDRHTQRARADIFLYEIVLWHARAQHRTSAKWKKGTNKVSFLVGLASRHRRFLRHGFSYIGHIVVIVVVVSLGLAAVTSKAHNSHRAAKLCI